MLLKPTCNSYDLTFDNLPKAMEVQISSQATSQYGCSSQWSAPDKFNLADVLSIEECLKVTKVYIYEQLKVNFRYTTHLKMNHLIYFNFFFTNIKEFTCITYGKTGMIVPSSNGWTYQGCATCTKGIKPVEGGFTCIRHHFTKIPVPR